MELLKSSRKHRKFKKSAIHTLSTMESFGMASIRKKANGKYEVQVRRKGFAPAIRVIFRRNVLYAVNPPRFNKADFALRAAKDIKSRDALVW